MKRLFLLFALVALASCVKENTMAPETQKANDVTIKAVSAASKATLSEDNFLDVLWKENDAIKVVLFDGDQTVATEFAAESVDGNEATFGGTFADFDLDFGMLELSYAVSPASAYNPETGVISVTLPDNQIGGVKPEMLLASSYLDPLDLELGETFAEFKSALTLLHVVVPAGVQSVSLSAANNGDYLVGTCEFAANTDGELKRQWFSAGGVLKTVKLEKETKVEVEEGEEEEGEEEEVELQNEELEESKELDAKTYPVLVLAGNPKSLTLHMVDMDGDSYDKTIEVSEFVAGTARKIDLTKIFNLAVPATLDVTAAGGQYSWTAVAADKEFTVTTDATWLKSSVVATKAFEVGYILLDVEKNVTGAERSADVVVTWNGGSQTLTVTQPSLYIGFVYDEETNPLEFVESFGLYNSADDANSKVNATSTVEDNRFRIEINTAKPGYGTYVVTNIFKSNSYYDHNGQPQSNKGGVYYAEYADGQLTLKKDNSDASYGFGGDVTLLYDETSKTFTLEESAKHVYCPWDTKYRYLGGYTAVEYVEKPATEPSGVEALYGEYTETFGGSYPTPGKTIIEASDKSGYDVKVTFFKPLSGYGSCDVAYGKVNTEGTEISFDAYTSNLMGPLSAFTLTVDGNNLSGSYGGTFNYTATK